MSRSSSQFPALLSVPQGEGADAITTVRDSCGWSKDQLEEALRGLLRAALREREGARRGQLWKLPWKVMDG